MFIHTLRTLLAMLAALTTLSDDDDDCGVSAPASSSSQLVVAVPNIDSAISRTRPSRKRKASFLELTQIHSDMRRNLRHIVSSSCRCFKKGKSRMKSNCFEPFRDQSRFEEVLKLRKTLHSMHKADADQTAPCQPFAIWYQPMLNSWRFSLCHPLP